MMRRNYHNSRQRPGLLYGWILVMILAGCNKYQTAGPISSPAYLRVFNSIPYDPTVLNSETPPFLCFLIDPTFDAKGAPSGGSTVGDWLQIRELYTQSYPIDAGTALNAGNGAVSGGVVNSVTNQNLDWPGKEHVAAAPDMNGLDLSAWGQVPSGKHRIVFVTRPQNNTPFSQLASTLRTNVLIDTTLDLSAGHVYTLEATASNVDSGKYGAYMRDEQFIRQKFDSGHLYTAFYNLSGTPSFLTTNPNLPDYYYLSDTLSIYYTYNIFDDNYGTGAGEVNPNQPPTTPLSTANNVFLATVIRGRDDLSVLTPMPSLPQSDFFTDQNFIRTYQETNDAPFGTMPFVSFNFVRSAAQQPLGGYPELMCNIDPAVYNNLSPDMVNNSSAVNLYGVINEPQFLWQVNLFQTVESAGNITVYPTINVFEIIYDRIYLMQIEHQFNNVPD